MTLILMAFFNRDKKGETELEFFSKEILSKICIRINNEFNQITPKLKTNIIITRCI